MAIQVASNFLLKSRNFLDARQSFDTILAMTSFSKKSVPEGFITYCKETDKYYKFNSTNSVDSVLGKWREYTVGGGSATDEKVKIDSTATDAKYLNELIDNATIEIDSTNNYLVVKKIDGQTVSVAELNFLTGVKSNIQTQIDALGKSMTMYGVFNTKSDLLNSISPAPVDGNTAIVIADETNNNKQMTYIYIDSTSSWTQVAESSITIRDFTTNPIDLSTEVTGILPNGKIDTAIARLTDVLDKITYKGTGDGIVKQADKLTGLTVTIDVLNQAVSDSHAHNNKAVLDKIVSNGIGNAFLADNGKYIEILHIDSTSPAYDSQIWIDTTDNSKPIFKIYDGTNWIAISGSSGVSANSAESVSYQNNDYPTLTNVSLALNNLFNKVYYVKPTCSLSADKKDGTFEIGTVISAPITFTWTTNKDITTQTLTDCSLANEAVRTAIYNTDISNNKTFTLTVFDGENSASSSLNYSFLNKIHWGNSTDPITYDSAFILGLTNSKLASSNKGNYSFNAGVGEYCYFATPITMKITSAWVNGFQADLEEVATNIIHTNASGYTSTYTITRFKNSGLGSFSAILQ